MTGLVSSHSWYAFVGLGLLWIPVGAAGQKLHSDKQLRKVQMFIVQQDDSLSEISYETAVTDLEHFGMSPVAGPRNTVVLARLSGGNAAIRYAEGQDIRIIALLPGSIHPQQFDLQSFETRVAELGPFRGAPGPNWNTRSFRARQLKDGRWLLEPSSQLSPGEYCFSPKFNNDNFCFGVDKK